jgi:hypothetical protein
MATVCFPASGRLTASFAGVAKYYAVGVDICPPRRGNRKGVVERQLADAEPLRRCPPAPFPAELQATHAVTGKGWCRSRASSTPFRPA